MFWLDRIYGQIEAQLKGKIASGKTLFIRDEKTASGRVHVGSMRALALHQAIAERLEEAKIPHIFKFEINDFDPMDGLPVYLDKAVYEKEMGKPLYMIPSPDGKAKNFAEYFGDEFIEAIKAAGFTPEFYRGSELYLSGKMNEAIRMVLDKADVVRSIYKEVSGAERANDWFALSVICENCGKVGTTKVHAWDGTEVSYHCYPTAVKWAVGCDHEGKTSPFDGRAKLPWKVEWAAKWFVLGVDIEGGGKDHYSKGGARDVARNISKDIFNYPEPFGVPNEFFLIDGKKMSSSKGKGASAKAIVELVPPKIFRLALFGKDINQQITFEPEGETIPLLYDQYDKLLENHRANNKDDYERLFTFLRAEEPLPGFVMRFSQVAFLVQMPHLNLEKEAEALKGSSLSAEDKKELNERAEYAKKWLDEYAPEKFVFKLQDSLPENAKSLSDIHKKALSLLSSYVKSQNALGDMELRSQFKIITAEAGVEPLQFYQAIYLSFLGKESGPPLSKFLSVMDKSMVEKRLTEASMK